MSCTNESHFLHVVRALTYVSGLTLVGCAAQSVDPRQASDVVNIPDTFRQDTSVADVIPPSDAPTGCENPGPNGAPCREFGSCGTMGCGTWECIRNTSTGALQWQQLLCGGPVRPPELAV